MKASYSCFAWLGLPLFAVGVLIGLALSAAILWGEIEVRLDAPYNSSAGLDVKCPLMLSPAESGKLEAVVVNSTDQQVKPVVIADLNRSAEVSNQTTLLAPRQKLPLEWTIDGSNVIFGRLILMNIYQSPYRDNPSRLGSCSTLSFSLFGLTGMQSFSLLFAGSLIAILLGGGLWLYARWQSNVPSRITQPGIILGVMTIAALLSTAARAWGLTLFLNAMIVLMGGIVATEFLLTPKQPER